MSYTNLNSYVYYRCLPNLEQLVQIAEILQIAHNNNKELVAMTTQFTDSLGKNHIVSWLKKDSVRAQKH